MLALKMTVNKDITFMAERLHSRLCLIMTVYLDKYRNTLIDYYIISNKGKNRINKREKKTVYHDT